VFVAIKIAQAEASVALNSHVYINSYLAIFMALKKLKMVICKYKAGIESESINSNFNPSKLLLSVSDFDSLTLYANIAETIIAP
jgi:hypothetical protein